MVSLLAAPRMAHRVAAAPASLSPYSPRGGAGGVNSATLRNPRADATNVDPGTTHTERTGAVTHIMPQTGDDPTTPDLAARLAGCPDAIANPGDDDDTRTAVRSMSGSHRRELIRQRAAALTEVTDQTAAIWWERPEVRDAASRVHQAIAALRQLYLDEATR